jgi:hypothetical protein
MCENGKVRSRPAAAAAAAAAAARRGAMASLAPLQKKGTLV